MSCKKCPKLPHSENITPLQQFSWTLWRTKSGDDMTGGGRRDGASSAGGAGGGVGRKTLGKKCPKYSRGPPTGPALLGPQLAVATRWSCNSSLQLLCILQPNRARNFSLQRNFSATQLLCILQRKGARNFRATELVCNPTKLSRSSRAAQELPVESQKNLIFVIRFNWCLVSGILTT